LARSVRLGNKRERERNQEREIEKKSKGCESLKEREEKRKKPNL
jgi:hypothetical protein